MGRWERRAHTSVGLFGRILIILLVTVAIEFAVGALLYERASRFSLREDEAHRLAEHLVISRKLIAERPVAERNAISIELTTDRYDIHWTPTPMSASPLRLTPELRTMRRQILTWEPSLANSDLQLRLLSPGREARIEGTMRLPDRSLIYFGARDSVRKWEFTFGRLGLAVIPAIALLIMAGLLVRRTLHPLRKLVQAAERIESDDPVDLPETGSVEVRHLIRAFKDMRDRIRLMIADRTEALAAVGHDLRTPLARLRLRMDSVDDAELREAMEADAREMEHMIGSVLTYLAGEEPEPPVLVDVAALAATLVDQFQDRGDAVLYEGPAHLDATIRPGNLRRALGNLVENGLHYGQSVVLTLADDETAMTFTVEDDGPGIPPERMGEALRPFKRLNPARRRNTKGLGLGLAIVDRVCRQEGGRLELSNRPEGGLAARIVLPPRPAARRG